MYINENGKVRVVKVVVHAVIALMALVLLFGSVGTVGAGSIGVKTTFSAVSGTVQPGLYFKKPFVDHVIEMDTQTQKQEVKSVEAASKDLQTVTTNVAVNYHLDPSKASIMYQNVGVDYADRLIAPAIQESVKATTAKYTAEELITDREAAREGIISLLTAKMQPFGITTDALNITNFDFSKTFNDAIEAKVTAEQNALAQKNKLEQVKYEAEQKVTTARADAEATRLISDAANNEKYIQLKQLEVQMAAIKAWNGVLPTQMVPNSAVPFIQLGK